MCGVFQVECTFFRQTCHSNSLDVARLGVAVVVAIAVEGLITRRKRSRHG